MQKLEINRMKLKSKRGFYISNSRKNALLFEAPPDIRDAFWFENSCDISEERMREYMKELDK